MYKLGPHEKAYAHLLYYGDTNITYIKINFCSPTMLHDFGYIATLSRYTF